MTQRRKVLSAFVYVELSDMVILRLCDSKTLSL